MTKYRRKAMPCVLCGEEETRDWDYICWTCRADWKRGAAQRESQGLAKTNQFVAKIVAYWHFYRSHGVAGMDSHDAGREIQNALMQLIGAVRDDTKHWHAGWGIGLPREGDSRNAQVGTYFVNGDMETLELVQKVYEMACTLMARSYEEGLRQGRSFVRALADGDMTVNQLQDKFLRD